MGAYSFHHGLSIVSVCLPLLLGFDARDAIQVAESCAQTDAISCETGDTDQSGLLQGPHKKDVDKLKCGRELLEAASDEILKVIHRKGWEFMNVTESDVMNVFVEGYDPNNPMASASAMCEKVKKSHLRAFLEATSESNGNLALTGNPQVTFEQYAVMQVFECLWRNRHLPSETFMNDPYDTCPAEVLCGMVVQSRRSYDHMLMPYMRRKGKAFGDRSSWGPGWSGTGKVNPIVRVGLLHKSDGTATANETILGRSGLRLSVVNGGWATPATLNVPDKYDQHFQIAWGPLRDGMLPYMPIGGPPLALQSGLAAVTPGATVGSFSSTGVIAKMPPPKGDPLTMVIIGDPCVGNMIGAGQCNFRDYYGVNKTIPVLLNAALPSSDVWYLTGDNFYDRYGMWTLGIFAQLDEAAQGVPLLTTPGNHDYWFEGDPHLSVDGSVRGYDQFGNGLAQFYGMDTRAATDPAPPPSKLLVNGSSDADFSFAPAFLDFSADPGSFHTSEANAKASNFQHYSIAGNVGFVMFTSVGEDPRKSFVPEACTFMKKHNPKLVLFLGHWNKPGSGCPEGQDVASVARWALDHSDCSAFRGSGLPPYGSNGTAATRLKFVVGHQHCNCKTNFLETHTDGCLEDEAESSFVDGFIIGSHGMSWDPQGTPSCSARFGLPVLRTDGGELTAVAYAKLSLETTITHCPAYAPWCSAKPGEVSRTDLLKAFLGMTPTAWELNSSIPYGYGILTDSMDKLLACLREKGTAECSKDTAMFDVWYKHSLE